ncbi:hypothetical protein [Streptomyces chrestomyceticus]|uniref:hypothetical protein n=1 Tax=Streptomyces chrestomyceticus TaxID=68185 RepID=UPI0033F6F73E
MRRHLQWHGALQSIAVGGFDDAHRRAGRSARQRHTYEGLLLVLPRPLHSLRRATPVDHRAATAVRGKRL